MAFAAGGRKGSVRADINITPLVDVVLVLLIIFMVLTPIMLKQTDLKVPQKADVDVAPPPVTSEQVVLHIAADGKLKINNEPVAPDQLVERVRGLYANRRESDKVMFFDVEDQANYGEVVKVMDQCRGAGVKVLGIMTKS